MARTRFQRYAEQFIPNLQMAYVNDGPSLMREFPSVPRAKHTGQYHKACIGRECKKSFYTDNGRKLWCSESCRVKHHAKELARRKKERPAHYEDLKHMRRVSINRVSAGIDVIPEGRINPVGVIGRMSYDEKVLVYDKVLAQWAGDNRENEND